MCFFYTFIYWGAQEGNWVSLSTLPKNSCIRNFLVFVYFFFLPFYAPLGRPALEPPLSFPGKKAPGDNSVSCLQMSCDPWLEQLLRSHSHMTVLLLQLPPSLSLSPFPSTGNCLHKAKIHDGKAFTACRLILSPLKENSIWAVWRPCVGITFTDL